MDGTIGAEISQQREVVRTWLARSEPGPESSGRLPGPASARSSGSLRSLSARDATVAAAPAALAPTSSVRADVSSVSSAVLAVPEASRADGEPSLVSLAGEGTFRAAVHRPRRRFAWTVAGAGGVALAVGLGFAIPRSSSDRTRAAGSPEALSQGGGASSAPADPRAAASGAGTQKEASAVTSADAGSTALPGTPGARAPRVAPAKPGGGAAPVRKGRAAGSSPADDLDDLSRNPYR